MSPARLGVLSEKKLSEFSSLFTFPGVRRQLGARSPNMKHALAVLAVALLAAPSAGAIIAAPVALRRIGGTQAVLRRPRPAVAANVHMGPGLFQLAGLTVPKQAAVAVRVNSGIAALGMAKGQSLLTRGGLFHSWALGVILGRLGLEAGHVCAVPAGWLG